MYVNPFLNENKDILSCGFYSNITQFHDESRNLNQGIHYTFEFLVIQYCREKNLIISHSRHYLNIQFVIIPIYNLFYIMHK